MLMPYGNQKTHRAQKANTSQMMRKPVRKISPARRATYRRRRIVVCTVLLLLLMLAIFCIISVGKGLAALGSAITGHEVTLTRKAVPDPRPVGLTPRCTARDIRLEVSTQSQNVPMGGSVELTERFVYEGNTSCLIDASNMNAVLAIASSYDITKDKQNNKDNDSKKDNQTSKNADFLSKAVWRSDACDVPLKPLLMAKGDHFERKITWNTNATVGKGCIADNDLPKVNRGTYVVRLEHKRVPGLRSEPVLINVQ